MYFTNDTVASAIVTETTDDTTDNGFDLDTVPTTRIQNDPWTDAFDTDEFFTLDTVVARPIEQTYVIDSDSYTFKKPPDELRRAAWSVDNVPYPLTHPSGGPVRDTSDVHGFLREPRYVEDRDEYGDALVATLYVPTTDDEAQSFIANSRSVSVGFYNDLEWEVDDDGVDAHQTNILIDHVAGVERGRCSIEDGCGINVDAVTTLRSGEETRTMPQSGDPFREGQWVKWTENSETVHGRLLAVDGERALVKKYDSERGGLADWPNTIPTDELETWVGPSARDCDGDDCTCGCHTLSDVDVTTDAPSGIHVEDGDWYGIAPSETADGEPKYELNNCNDVKDAFNLRNNGDFDVEVSTLVERIKRAASSHDCGPERKPWTDTTDGTSSDANINMTEDTETNDDTGSIDFDSIVSGMSLDALAESNDAVAQLQEDAADLESTVEVLEDKVETLEDERDELQSDLESYREAEKDELVDDITDLTSAWDEDTLRDESVEELERRKAIAEDAATSPSTPTDDGGEQTDDEPTTDSDSDGGYTVAMEHRSWG